MKLIDLSQPLHNDAPNCPAHPNPRSVRTADHPQDGWRMEVLTMASHTGSHVDAPLHKIRGGRSISEMPLDTFAGPARVADLRPLPPLAPIGPELLDRHLPDLQPGEIALLCTGWGEIRSRTETWLRESPYLTPAGARWLVTRSARAVGIDHYSIGGSREPANSDTHTILLDSGLWVVEELLFSPEALAAPRPAHFLALPINLQGHSGAFCRPVFLIDGPSPVGQSSKLGKEI